MITGLLAQAAPPQTDYWALVLPGIISVVTVIAGGGILKVIFDRKVTSATADKTAVEGEVAASADSRAWIAEWRSIATDARAAMEKAEASAREAIARADAADRETANLREEIADLKELVERREAEVKRRDAKIDELLARIRSCDAGAVCPIAEAIKL